ncbi:MAG: hypothetical protein LKJ59_00940 [Oscillospiraceae bacterium]|jgi:hypothetical protein|nr:hypothetical protein [Oscillospiraceae bacterium]MCI2035063.1 hypothetical protein [Oscillospiraceae bacterium]
MMVTFFTENENKETPPEKDPDPAGDGSPERSPEPRMDSGSRAELVSDDTEAYEEQQTGVALSYVLKEQDVYRYLRRRSFSGKWGAVFSAAFLVLLVLAFFFLTQAVRNGDGRMYFWAALYAAIGAAALLYLRRKLHRAAEKFVTGREIRLKIYPDRMEADNSAERLKIPLDGTAECVRLPDLILLIPPDRKRTENRETRTLILPLRCVDEAVLPYVEAMILAGTRPKGTQS